ncbi:hypothetical protein [Streptococcus zalophi]|uniref:hypothetical protein n=1 Tax=Streptococcus zalophi TaxID=640031 RepID=UPI00215C2F2B|nr:hypothetical protein [Streptococcus zalophi]MCR8967086.1 hypothetical protein [Streptococcus zalophi]
MKNNIFGIFLIFLVLLSAIFLGAPFFMEMNLPSDPRKTILEYVLMGPLYYIFSQCLHTVILLITVVLFRTKPIYFYFLLMTKLGSKIYHGVHFNQVIGFSPGIAIWHEKTKSFKLFFRVYFLLYFCSLIGYYILFTSIYRNFIALLLIPFSLIIALIQKLYKTEYQQLFLLKSKVLTILETKKDCQFNLEDYSAIWQLNSKNDAPFIALSYISLIKKYLSEEMCQKIERIEDERLQDKGYTMGFYGMLDIIKLNLYLSVSEKHMRYRKMLNSLFSNDPSFTLVRQDTEDGLIGKRDLPLSFAIAEIQQLLLDVYYDD